jgi:hypothetical protein
MPAYKSTKCATLSAANGTTLFPTFLWAIGSTFCPTNWSALVRAKHSTDIESKYSALGTAISATFEATYKTTIDTTVVTTLASALGSTNWSALVRT